MSTKAFIILKWINEQGLDNTEWSIENFIDCDTEWFFSDVNKRTLNGKYLWIYVTDRELRIKSNEDLSPDLIIETYEEDRILMYKI